VDFRDKYVDLFTCGCYLLQFVSVSISTMRLQTILYIKKNYFINIKITLT